ncbi:MAG: hypothetical protein QXY76_02995 [Nitrososphaeria archaeon]
MPKKPNPPNISLSDDLVINRVKSHNALIEPCNDAAGNTLLDEILTKMCEKVKRIVIAVKSSVPSILCIW